MATGLSTDSVRQKLRELRTGDRMTQREFHPIYKQTPENFRAELIGGIVYDGDPRQRSGHEGSRGLCPPARRRPAHATERQEEVIGHAVCEPPHPTATTAH